MQLTHSATSSRPSCAAGCTVIRGRAPEAFSASRVTQTLGIILRRLHLQSHYSGYSFRRGIATHARDAGLPDPTIQLLVAESPIFTFCTWIRIGNSFSGPRASSRIRRAAIFDFLDRLRRHGDGVWACGRCWYCYLRSWPLVVACCSEGAWPGGCSVRPGQTLGRWIRRCFPVKTPDFLCI